MTSEAQRTAIAEACGWKDARFSHQGKPLWQDPSGMIRTRGLPDYLGDLNAMHEAEKAVIFKEVKLYLKFATELEMVVGGNIDALFAIAAQRAEAFLRTLGLWKE